MNVPLLFSTHVQSVDVTSNTEKTSLTSRSQAIATVAEACASAYSYLTADELEAADARDAAEVDALVASRLAADAESMPR